MVKESQINKAKTFRDLHSGKSLLILPNVWDPLGAALLEELGYPAVATASASISYTHGVADGENLKFSDLLILLKKIAAAVHIPVTADIESGYAHSVEELRENIDQILEAGIAGVNIEDYDLKNKTLYPVEVQCRRLRAVRERAEAAGIPLYINARTDVYVKGTEWLSAGEKWEETRNRGMAYLEAGADGIYPITMNREEDIEKLVTALSCPVNILAIPGIPDFKRLTQMGVARLSTGPGFLKIAVCAMKQAALQLLNGEGLTTITDNEITSEYLKRLVSHAG
jgi:2-methylisocitrate lyase-like PEP mutase family enzyme